MSDDWDPFADPALEACRAPSTLPNEASCPFSQSDIEIPSVAQLEQDLALLDSLDTAQIPATLGPAKPLCQLTREEALSLQDDLIEEYSTNAFQTRLEEKWYDSGDDAMQQGRARQEVCLPVQVPIVSRYGFEASRRGVYQSVRAFAPWNADPDVAERNQALQWLVNPDLQQGKLTNADHYLKPCVELVDKASEGNIDAVKSLLMLGNDPNTIVEKVERHKGSDGCCAVLITSEEYTPLIAACMGGHQGVLEELLDHSAIDLNTVCFGLNGDTGPYKSFTALDIAIQMQWETVQSRLKSMGAKCAKHLSEPPWPREKSEGTKVSKALKPSIPKRFKEKASVKVPDTDYSSQEMQKSTSSIVERMQEKCHCSFEERSKLFKRLMLEWHPDKRPEREKEHATRICQWLTGVGRCFITAA